MLLWDAAHEIRTWGVKWSLVPPSHAPFNTDKMGPTMELADGITR